MGHDIYGIRPSRKGQNSWDTRSAYLGRTAFDPLNDSIYKILGCMDFYGGVSGTGEEKIFTGEELMIAKAFIPDGDTLEYEREFLQDCIDNLEENKILIRFM